MIVLIERLTVRLTRLTCFRDNEWQVHKSRFSQQINSDLIRIEQIDTKEDAKWLIVQRGAPFKEYISSTNDNDLIIELISLN